MQSPRKEQISTKTVEERKKLKSVPKSMKLKQKIQKVNEPKSCFFEK